ncbi:MAG: response regulator [Rhodocyclaceae bacterium]|nr:response regulator [Rhodocyclaceae bacterium]
MQNMQTSGAAGACPRPPVSPAVAGRKRELWRDDVLQAMLRRHAGKRILIADDSPTDRVRLGELLAAARFQLDFAVDGADAVTRASDRPADLVLMHVRMPVMDGLTATRVLRVLSFGRHVPIVAMSFGSLDDDGVACFAAGMDDIVAKPFVADAVHRCLLRWLDRRAAGVCP